MLPNPTAQKAFEQEHGLRYSKLIHLGLIPCTICLKVQLSFSLKTYWKKVDQLQFGE